MNGWNLIRFVRGIDNKVMHYSHYEFWNGSSWEILGMNLGEVRFCEDLKFGTISKKEVNKVYRNRHKQEKLLFSFLPDFEVESYIKLYGGKTEVIQELEKYEIIKEII